MIWLTVRFITLLAARDVQMLALISCIVLDYTRKADVPPQPETSIARSPEQDYFTLLPRHTPRHTPTQITPLRKRSSMGPADQVYNQSQISYRSSGWSQILNPSSLSIRTPGRPTLDTQIINTPLGTSYEGNSPGSSMPVPIRRQSPRVRLEGRNRPSLTAVQSQSPPRQQTTPITPGARSTGTERSLGKSGGTSSLGPAPGSSGIQKTLGHSNDRMKSGITDRSITNVNSGDKHRVSFGGNSPMRRNASRVTAWSNSTPGREEVKRAKTCSVRIEIPQDDE
jgi:hypothetical protein